MKSVLAIIGPSGVGKSSIIKGLEATGKFLYIKPITTRAPRGPEDTEKTFVDRATFERMRDNEDLFNINEVYGNLYAYSRSAIAEIHARDMTPVCDLIIEAIPKFRDEGSTYTITTIFIAPPSLDELRKRLDKENRFDAARWEKDKIDLTRARIAPGIDIVLTNDKVQRCVMYIDTYMNMKLNNN